MLRKPCIPFNSLTTMRPELIGLAAWLCVADKGDYTRKHVLTHASIHGDLEALEHEFPFKDSPGDYEMARQALEEGKRFVVEEPQPIAFRRAPIAANGHRLSELPPVAGGAPVDLVAAETWTREYDRRMDGTDDIEF
jgi:hypothetical protein